MYGDFEAAERYAAEHVAFCVERKVEQFRLWGGNYQASARAMREPTEENVAALRGAIAANNRSGGYFSDSIFKSYLAETLLMRGEIAGAEAAIRTTSRSLKPVSSRPSKSPAGKKPACSNCAPPPTLSGYGARQVKPNDPRALLEPILAAIEGEDTTRDVRNARALLAGIV